MITGNRRVKQLLAASMMGLQLMACGHPVDRVETRDVNVDTVLAKETTEAKDAGQDLFAMDTYMTLSAYGVEADEAVNAAVEEIKRLDQLLSTGDKNSEISQLNISGEGVLSDVSRILLEKSLELYQETEGAFDLAIYPIMSLWGFTGEHFYVPSQEEIDRILPLTDPSLIGYDVSTGRVSFEESGVQIDFGGIAKGYTSARVVEIYESYDVERGLINLGGNVHVYGTKEDGSAWRVAIQDPKDSTAYIGVLETHDRAVITSGDYERYFEEGGVTYHHIIDPKTGYPARSGLVSVTIVSEDDMLADGLSTSMFVMGKEAAVDYWRRHHQDFEMILVDDNNQVYITEGIAEDFSSEALVEIIKKEMQ